MTIHAGSALLSFDVLPQPGLAAGCSPLAEKHWSHHQECGAFFPQSLSNRAWYLQNWRTGRGKTANQIAEPQSQLSLSPLSGDLETKLNYLQGFPSCLLRTTTAFGTPAAQQQER